MFGGFGGTTVGKAAVELRGEFGGLQRDLAKAEKMTEGSARRIEFEWNQRSRRMMAVGAVMVTAVAAIGLKGVHAAAKYGDEVRNLTRELGVSAKQASHLIQAAGQFGVEVDKLSGGMGIMAKHVAANDAAARKYGLTLRDQNGRVKDGAQLLSEFQTVIQKLPPGVERTAAALELMGRGGKELLPILMLTREEMAEIAAETKRFGLELTERNLAVVQDYRFAVDDLNDAWGGLQVQLGMRVIPTLTRMTTSLTNTLAFFGQHPQVAQFTLKLIALSGAFLLVAGAVAKFKAASAALGLSRLAAIPGAGPIAAGVGAGLALNELFPSADVRSPLPGSFRRAYREALPGLLSRAEFKEAEEAQQDLTAAVDNFRHALHAAGAAYQSAFGGQTLDQMTQWAATTRGHLFSVSSILDQFSGKTHVRMGDVNKAFAGQVRSIRGFQNDSVSVFRRLGVGGSEISKAIMEIGLPAGGLLQALKGASNAQIRELVGMLNSGRQSAAQIVSGLLGVPGVATATRLGTKDQPMYVIALNPTAMSIAGNQTVNGGRTAGNGGSSRRPNFNTNRHRRGGTAHTGGYIGPYGVVMHSGGEVPITALSGEFMHQRAAVDHYGLGFMHAVNERRYKPLAASPSPTISIDMRGAFIASDEDKNAFARSIVRHIAAAMREQQIDTPTRLAGDIAY